MSYADGRLIHDADSHLMEPADCLDPYFEKRLLDRFLALPRVQELRTGAKAQHVGERLALQRDAAFRAAVGPSTRRLGTLHRGPDSR